MKNKWIILSWILLFIFGSLYFLGTFLESQNEVIKIIQSSADLWANLFASMIAVLFLDIIVRRTEIQKSQRSIRYIHGRLLNAYERLIFDLRPPANWEKKLDNLDFEEYLQRVLTLKENARITFDEILDKYGGLIETDLRNDVFDTVGLLNMPTWVALEEPTRCRADKLWNVRNYANLIYALSATSNEIIKNHNLLENFNSLVFKNGKPILEESNRPVQAKKFSKSLVDEVIDEIKKLRDTVNKIS